ncbi:DNA polymerase III subunit chi [Dinoroseobacter sp. PD6]|uniref:DNA polymerase III subunit chi n=1 Tax=Dinoroseobacter sp. PD6 TaxID=3028384 RepID=UPI00237C412A|nr:DNA polymerase III subunit chi [Dinoroseobacter sp. PD6]MDD9716034.1 DNA polymerase III subunit chi [Dinoroseobacter sp. PD6]
MGVVYFYHMTRTPLDATLPVLLEKSLAAGWRVLVRGTSGAELERLDELLWLRPEEGFLPHGIAGGDRDADQPVLLGVDAPLAGREALICVDGAQVDPAEVAGLARASLLFDGGDAAAVEAARGQWRAVTGAGLSAQYWSQESGRWEKKAEA